MSDLTSNLPPLVLRLGRRSPHFGSALFFVVLVLLLNLPLVFQLDSHVIGRPFDDAFEVLWQLSAIRRAVFETHANPFYTPDIYYPLGWHTASGAQPPWYLLLLAPLTAVAGPVITYNITLLALFAAAGFGVYRFVARLSGDRPAGLVAGCVYIVAPVLTLRLGGHLNVLIAAMMLPFAAGALHNAMTCDTRPSRAVAVAALLLAATVLGHWYFLFIASLPLGAMALAVPSDVPWRSRLARLAAVGGLAIVVLAPFALLTWHARETMLPDGGAYSLTDTAGQGFSPDYLLSPNPLHPFWRQRAADLFPVAGEWDVVSMGFAAAGMALVGLLRAPWAHTRPFFAMGLLSFVLGLGPVLRWRGEPLVVPAPPWLSRAAAGIVPELAQAASQVLVFLPGLLLLRWVPLYSSMRVWARFDVPLMLALAVLAGLGASWLLGRGRAGRAAVVILGSLVVLEGLVLPYRDFTPVAIHDRSANKWLAERPAGSALIEYPRPGVDKLAMYSQSFHGQRVVNGYMSFQPSFLSAVDAQLGKWPTPEAVPVLREWGVDYLVLSGSPSGLRFSAEILPQTLAINGLCLVKTFPDAFSYPGLEHTYIFAVLADGQDCLSTP